MTDVHRGEVGPTALRSDAPDYLLAKLTTPAGERYRGAFFGKQLSDGSTNAASAACHQGNLVLQSHAVLLNSP
jgi:hypothetical protein